MNLALIHINSATRAASDVKSGYGDEFLIAEIGKFANIAGPVNDGTPGSTKLITSAHTFASGDGFTTLRGKMGTGGGDGDSIGEVGGSVVNFKPKVTVVGDGPVQWEYIDNLQHKEMMILAPAPDCDSSAPYTQFGGKCGSALITKVTFKGGLKNAGNLKEYEIEFSTFDKFFYSGTVTKKAASASDAVYTLIDEHVFSAVSLDWPIVAAGEIAEYVANGGVPKLHLSTDTTGNNPYAYKSNAFVAGDKLKITLSGLVLVTGSLVITLGSVSMAVTQQDSQVFYFDTTGFSSATITLGMGTGGAPIGSAYIGAIKIEKQF